MHIRLRTVTLTLTSVACLSMLTFATVCFADDGDDRNKLAGTWNADAGGNEAWTVHGTKAGGVHLTFMRGTQKAADFECGTEGKECSTHIDGKSVKVSLYFNGPKLVMLETRGDTVVKWRFGVASDSEMEVETMPITPPGKAETMRFKHAAEEQAASR